MVVDPFRFNRGPKFRIFLLSLAITCHFSGQFEFEMLFRSVRVQRLPRFAIDRDAAEVPFLWIVRRPKRGAEFIRKRVASCLHPCVIGQISLGALSLAL